MPDVMIMNNMPLAEPVPESVSDSVVETESLSNSVVKTKSLSKVSNNDFSKTNSQVN